VLLSTHYSKPMDWTEEKVRAAKETLWDFITAVQGVEPAGPDTEVIAALADDLNTAGAIARLHVLKKEGRAAELLASARLMGMLDFRPTAGAIGWGVGQDALERASAIAAKWAKLRMDRKFDDADDLKAKAAEAGIELRVIKEGVGQGATAHIGSDFDPAKLEALK